MSDRVALRLTSCVPRTDMAGSLRSVLGKGRVTGAAEPVARTGPAPAAVVLVRPGWGALARDR
jgi:hypothetical protein